MATAAEAAEFRRTVDALSTLAFRDLRALLNELSGEQNPVRVRQILSQVFPDLIGPYVSASAAYASVWYEDLRAASAQPGRFTARPQDIVPVGKYEAGVRYAVTPLFKQSTATVFSLLAGQAQKLIAGGARDTVSTNAGRERTQVGFQRIPSSGCCAFCAMVASRGAAYQSAESAGFVSGRGIDAEVTAGRRGGQGRGLVARGNQGLGSRYHDNCRCVVAPVFVGDTWSQTLADSYLTQYTGLGDDKPDETVLAEVRATNGLR